MISHSYSLYLHVFDNNFEQSVDLFNLFLSPSLDKVILLLLFLALLLSLVSSFSIVIISLLSDVWLVKIFAHSVRSLFVEVVFSSAVQTLFNLMYS